MKKEFLKGLTMLLLIVVLALATAVASANAQSANRVIADIPFEFSVGYKTMPAGEYSVETVTASGNAVMIRSTDGNRAAIRLTDESARIKDKTQARLVFHRYGGRYFLAQVWNGVDLNGRQLVKSHEENAIEGELASISSKSELAQSSYETVEVLAIFR